MTARTPIGRSNREGYRKVVDLDGYITTALGKPLADLVYLRASFVNGCNYCVDSHSQDLIAGGVSVRKAFGVATWRESTFFTERERLALEFTDAVTAIANGIDDDLWDRVGAEFGEEGRGDLVLAIGTIGLWNRIGISSHTATPPLDA